MDKKKLSKEQILKELKSSHGSKPQVVLAEVAYNLALSGTTSETLVERATKAIEKLEAYGGHQSPLQAARYQIKAGVEACPICKLEMESVKLMEDRPAWYCQDHKVIIPKPKE